MTIQAVFFDLDDTLHDHQAPFASALFSSFSSFSADDIDIWYKKFRHYSDLLWRDYTKGAIPLEQLRIDRITLTMRCFELELTTDEAIQFQENYEHHLNNLTLFPEVPELFHTLRQDGYELGIITNGPTFHQRKKINQLGLHKLIDEKLIFISDEVGVAKPSPQIFHHAASKINLPAQKLLYVGDTWENDVAGPISAGWNTVWFNHRSRQPLTEVKPMAKVKSLLGVLAVL